MEAIRTHVAGVDVHKKILAITVLIGEGNESPRIERFECSTFTDDLLAMGIKFLELGVKDVAMESTGIYWKPLHNVWAPGQSHLNFKKGRILSANCGPA